MISFDEKYGKIHKQIQEDSKLVKQIFRVAKKHLYPIKKQLEIRSKDNSKLYFPCGKIGGIYLGVHMYENKAEFIKESLTNLRLIYDISKGKADIPKVYFKLVPRKKSYFGMGILSEDFTEAGKYGLEEETFGSDLDMDLLLEIFDKASGDDQFTHSTFSIYNKTKKDFRKIIRNPMVDVDLMKPNKKYKKLYEKYKTQYKRDERFIIRER